MAQALINAKKYLYAEGLLRRLLAMVIGEQGTSADLKPIPSEAAPVNPKRSFLSCLPSLQGQFLRPSHFSLKANLSKKHFEIQLHSMETYFTIMTKFNRVGEANEIRAAIAKIKEHGFRRDIEFFAYFDQFEFKTH